MKYITSLLIGLLISQSAFAYTNKQCVWLQERLNREVYTKVCEINSGDVTLTDKEFLALSPSERVALITVPTFVDDPQAEEPQQRQEKQVSGPLNLTINNNLPAQNQLPQPPPVVHESSSGVWPFLLGGIVATGVWGFFYYQKGKR